PDTSPQSIPQGRNQEGEVPIECAASVSPENLIRLELLAVREIISPSAPSSASSLFRWFASHFKIDVLCCRATRRRRDLESLPRWNLERQASSYNRGSSA